MKTVLIVDKNEFLHNLWKRYLENSGFKIFITKDPGSARDIFNNQRKNLDIIFVGSCTYYYKLDPTELPTLPFVEYARASGFKKPMIAMTAIEEFARELIVAGCSNWTTIKTHTNLERIIKKKT